jgi:hypothetical protein
MGALGGWQGPVRRPSEAAPWPAAASRRSREAGLAPAPPRALGGRLGTCELSVGLPGRALARPDWCCSTTGGRDEEGGRRGRALGASEGEGGR